MRFKELRSLESAELNLKLAELRKELVKLNAQVATGTAVKSAGQINNAKKGIAQILTLLNSKKVIKSKEASKKA